MRPIDVYLSKRSLLATFGGSVADAKGVLFAGCVGQWPASLPRSTCRHPEE